MNGGLGDGELETAHEMTAAVAAGEVTVEEILDRTQRRVDAWEPRINAFSQRWDGEDVRGWNAPGMSGDRSEDSPARPSLPLRAPVAVKDLFDVAGKETTGCCDAYRGNLARRDAPTVERLLKSGLILLGKTNQHELAAGGTNVVSACGRTGNPWDPDRITGGSSGGSAAAVAAGVVPWALGSDTGGSIRIPSSMCGVFGLKPTTGRITTEGMLPLAPSMDCPGPLASTVRDLWMLYGALAGLEVGVGERPPAGDRRPSYRIGVPDGFFLELVQDETRAAVRSAAALLEGAGAVVEAVDGHGIEDTRAVWMRACTPEFAAAHPQWRELRDRIAPSVVEWLEMGERLTPGERERAAGRRADIRAWFEARLQDADALLVPTTPYPAPRAGQQEVRLGAAGTVDVGDVGPGWMTCAVNLAGLPAMNLPAATSSDGMPIGVSLVGSAGAEPVLFGIASLWEAAAERPPPRPARPSP